MNPETFSDFGYASVALWGMASLLWLAYLVRPTRMLASSGLLFCVFAWFLGNHNSKNHVIRIQVDRSSQVADLNEVREAKLTALKDSRHKEIAPLQFAEDDAGDALDLAGMDDEDLAYMEKLQSEGEPEWKKTKKSRSKNEDGEGEGMEALEGENVIAGIEPELAQTEKNMEPSAIMNDADFNQAQKLDSLNLQAIRWLCLLGVLICISDYLRRANVYGKASFALPLPSSWLNWFTPLPSLVQRPSIKEPDMSDELRRLTARGDSFLYLGTDEECSSSVPSELNRLFGRFLPVEIIHLTDDAGLMDDDFVFDSLWFGRGSYVVDSQKRADSLLQRFEALLEERSKVRAKVRQSVHLVFAPSLEVPRPQLEKLTRLSQLTGFSILLNMP